MKILFLFYDWANYYGGPIVNARRLLPELRRRGHEIHSVIFFYGKSAPSALYLEKQGVRCHLREFHSYTETKINWLLRKIADIQPDIFVPNLSVAGWFASRWAREAGIPTIACHRSDDPYYWAMVDQFVLGEPEWAVSGLVCVSDRLRRKVQERKPGRTKLRVIPSGVPVTEQRSDQEGPLKLAYVGRLVQEQKRILDLIDSLALIMRERMDVTAALIGDGKERRAARRQIDRHGLGERILLMGVLPSEQIQAALAQCHILVLLSDYEGTPGAVMDGMAAGLAPVCLDIPGGVRELIIHEKTGLLVNDRGRGFVEAVFRLADDSTLRKRIASNARRHVAQHYSLRVAADRWEAFCGELLEEAPQRSPVRIPEKLELPPVRDWLAREDRRMGSAAARAARAAIRLVKRIASKSLGRPR